MIDSTQDRRQPSGEGQGHALSGGQITNPCRRRSWTPTSTKEWLLNACNQRLVADLQKTSVVAKPGFLCSLLSTGDVFLVELSLLNMRFEVNKHDGNPAFQFWKPGAETRTPSAPGPQWTGLQITQSVQGGGRGRRLQRGSEWAE